MVTLNELYGLFRKHPLISTDSRDIQENSLFFALKGETFDGNAFAEMALGKGSVYAVIDNEKYNTSPSCILVDDALKTLQTLSRHHRLQFNTPVIAITGTNGKTTTKELISRVLSSQYRIIATEGNLNNHIGVPLTLLKLHPGIEIAVIEMGANHAGEIDFLSGIAAPTHGLITNIGKAHLEGFGGFDGVVKAKTELYRYLKSNRGTVFVNKGNSLLMQQLQGNKCITYGTDESADLHGKNIEGSLLVDVEINFRETKEVIHSHLFGKYNAENIMAAACIGQFFDVLPEKIKEAIESYSPENNRSQIKKTKRNLLVLDAYNANPSSMKEAITNFAETDCTNKNVIIGDMFELGEESDPEHLKLLDLIKTFRFQSVYLVGPVLTRLCHETEWHCFQDSDLARLWFEHHPVTGQTILVKGSRGIKLEKIIETL